MGPQVAQQLLGRARRGGPQSRGYTVVNEPALYSPPGVYVCRGQGLQARGGEGVGWDSQVWHIRGDGPNQARIQIANEVYFLTCSRVESIILEGLTFVGGKGAFRSAWAGNMVGGK